LVAVGGVIGVGLHVVGRDGGSGHPPRSPGIPIGAVAPPFTLAGQREVVTSTTFSGHNFVLAFMTPTCRTCAADLRRVGAIAPKLIGPAGLGTSYVVVDRGRPPGSIVEFARSVGLRAGPYLTSDRAGGVWRAYGVMTPGTVFVIGPNGHVVWRGIDPSLATLRAHVHAAGTRVDPVPAAILRASNDGRFDGVHRRGPTAIL
jgi:peroxiredoxin